MITLAKGARVRLRYRDDVVGTVLGAGFEPGRVRVLWDDTLEVTNALVARLALDIAEDRP